MEQYLTITIFVAIIVPSISGIIIALYLLFGKANSNKAEIETLKGKVNDIIIQVSELDNMYAEMVNKRYEDQIKFTEILAKINVTIAEFDLTLKNIKEVIQEIKNDRKDN